MTSITTTARHQPGLLLLLLAYAAFISLGLPDGLIGVAWPSMRASFGLPLDALGALSITTTVGYLAASFSSGRLMARFGVGWLLALSCIATAASLLGYATAPLWIFVVTLGLLGGLGAGAIDAGLNTYATAEFSPRTMNWLHAAFGLGATTGPLLMSAVLAAGESWKLGYLIVGMVQLLLAACFVGTRRLWTTQASAQAAPAASSAPMLASLRLPAVWLSVLLYFIYCGLEFTAGQWLYSVLTESRELAPTLAGVAVGAYWGSLTLGRILAGVLVEQISVQRLLWLALGGALLGALLIWLASAWWVALGGAALLGLALAPMFPLFTSLTPNRVGSAHTANTVGFQIAAAMLGGSTLVAGFGLLAERFGLETFGPTLVVLALLLIGLFALLERKPTL
jgi:fucose permease